MIMDERKRLYKSRNNKMICGVCAGIADYFNIDPSIVRVLWAVLALAAGTGVLAYIACAIILPEGDTEV
jgi:phage shock protein PspC (stress-responsive transcriptional regulator)